MKSCVKLWQLNIILPKEITMSHEFWIIKNAIKGNSGRTKSKFATKLLTSLIKHGKFKEVEGRYGHCVVIVMNGTKYFVNCAKFPHGDLSNIWMINEFGEKVQLMHDKNPSLFSRIRFWLWLNKYVRVKLYIKLLNCTNYDHV